MQNRRQRNYAQYQAASSRPVSRSVEPTTKKRTLLYVVAIVSVVAYLYSRGGNETTTQAAKTEAAVTAEIQPKQVQKQAPFPTLNTKGFTSVQQKMLAVMKEEYAKQPKSYDKTVLEYTEGTKESWCGDFISVVRFEAGKPFENQETGYWRIPGVQTLRDYYAASAAYKLVGSYTPKFGDVAFYFGETPDGNSREHVAFVLEVRGDTLVTLGGNETDKGILQVRYDKLELGTKGLAGFGVSNL